MLTYLPHIVLSGSRVPIHDFPQPQSFSFYSLTMSYLTKQELRKSIRKVLRSISPEVRRYQSNNIFERLQQVLEYQRAKSVGLFLSMKTEVETRPIMEDCFSHGRTVVVPKIISDCEFEWVSLDSTSRLDSLPKDKWGIPIPEYNDANRLLLHPEFTPDVIIVPGVAFDAKCQRLGHGKGYYGRDWKVVRFRPLFRVFEAVVFE